MFTFASGWMAKLVMGSALVTMFFFGSATTAHATAPTPQANIASITANTHGMTNYVYQIATTPTNACVNLDITNHAITFTSPIGSHDWLWHGQQTCSVHVQKLTPMLPFGHTALPEYVGTIR